jgi:hypothetical protein
VSDDLLSLLKNVPADVEANRAGRLGEQQLAVRERSFGRGIITLSVGAVVCCGLGLLIAHQHGPWLPIVLTGWLCLGVCGIFFSSQRATSRSAVRCLTGPVRPSRRVSYTTTGNAVTRQVALRFAVAGVTCRVPETRTTDLNRWQTLLGAGSYRVYVIGKDTSPMVVSLEPATPN